MGKVASSACILVAQVLFLRAVIIPGRSVLSILPILFHRILKRCVFRGQNLIRFIGFTTSSRIFIKKNSFKKYECIVANIVTVSRIFLAIALICAKAQASFATGAFCTLK